MCRLIRQTFRIPIKGLSVSPLWSSSRSIGPENVKCLLYPKCTSQLGCMHISVGVPKHAFRFAPTSLIASERAVETPTTTAVR
mmetsp:Transcript_85667/g.188130  ORF Transcript_85667/g.188130 Transcript_85667/m.188130 type:complete len:83 (+) Transcript_85667:193-441(+)